MLIGGAAWVIFISLINALVQNLVPDCVRARVLAIFILVYQGSYAFGTVVWGAFAQRASVRTALVYAGIGTIASIAIALLAKIPDSTADLSPWKHWRMPSSSRKLVPISRKDPYSLLSNALSFRSGQQNL
jgi:Transmembrane secretion effector